jgi:hypothetical protein
VRIPLFIDVPDHFPASWLNNRTSHLGILTERRKHQQTRRSRDTPLHYIYYIFNKYNKLYLITISLKLNCIPIIIEEVCSVKGTPAPQRNCKLKERNCRCKTSEADLYYWIIHNTFLYQAQPTWLTFLRLAAHHILPSLAGWHYCHSTSTHYEPISSHWLTQHTLDQIWP